MNAPFTTYPGLNDNDRGAVIDPTGQYRYLLWRKPNNASLSERAVGFLMLNPSTADHMKDDPTITRCTGFARDWGFSRFLVGNLHAFRTVSPKVLKATAKAGLNTVGPWNEWYLDYMFSACEFVVCAWGNSGSVLDRSAIVRGKYKDRDLRYLRLTKQREPEHPLYLPSILLPQRWSLPSISST